MDQSSRAAVRLDVLAGQLAQTGAQSAFSGDSMLTRHACASATNSSSSMAQVPIGPLLAGKIAIITGLEPLNPCTSCSLLPHGVVVHLDMC